MGRLSDKTCGEGWAAPVATARRLGQVIAMMRERGCERFLYKVLSRNDNSKNQLYVGGNFDAVSLLPLHDWEIHTPKSRKPTIDSRSRILRARLTLMWMFPNGRLVEAADSKAILYPQYPEVRLSGFVVGVGYDLSRWMDPLREGRVEGRSIVIGVTRNGQCIAWLGVPGSSVSETLLQMKRDRLNSEARDMKRGGALWEFWPREDSAYEAEDSRKGELLQLLADIHARGKIPGQKLNSQTGRSAPYNASNGGGYTLEALLGVFPNGLAEPDWYGWEVKAVGGSVLTLLTPEPDGGLYAREGGVANFIRKWGYPDRRGREDRLNIGGVYKSGNKVELTGLRLEIVGFESGRGSFEAEGDIRLVGDDGEVASSWSFGKLLGHWSRKHARTAIVKASSHRECGVRFYEFGPPAMLGEGTHFLRFLEAVAIGAVYYDPGIKMEEASTEAPRIKRRSQFRVRLGAVENLYREFECYDLAKVNPDPGLLRAAELRPQQYRAGSPEPDAEIT